MAGYADTRQLIIDTLMGRPAGTEIQPEDHQAFALALNDYIRSVELVAGSGVPIAFAEPDTVPVQPNNGQAVYLSYVPRSITKNFVNFIDQSGNSISVTSSSSEVKLVTLLWNGSYWSSQIVTIDVLSDDSSVNASNIGASDYALFSTSSNYSTGDIVRYDGKLYKFIAEHVAGAWTGTDVEQASINSILTIKLSELDLQINGKEVTENFRDGYYVNMISATIGNAFSYDINYAGASEGTRCYKISTTVGEKYVIKGKGISNYAGLFVLTGNENIVLQKIGTIDSRQNPVILDITETGFLYVNLVSYNAETDKVIRLDTSKTDGIAEDVKKLMAQPVIEQAEVVDDGNSLLLTKKGGEYIIFSTGNSIPKSYLLRESINLFDGNYILGSIAPSTGILINNTEVTRTYRTSDFIEVEEGASYKCSTANESGNRTYNNVFWTCYDETKTLIAGQEDTKKNSLTIPQGCKFIRISGQFLTNVNEETAKWMVYKFRNSDRKSTLESIFYALTSKSVLFDHLYSPKGYIEHLPNILHMNRKTYVALGDSLCDFSVFPEYVGYLLGIDAVNGGFGGCRMSDTHPQETYKAFGLVPIVDAIVSGDWSRQEAVLTTHAGEASSTSTWIERVNKLKTLDFRDVAFLSISYINNDYSSSILTGEKDSSDTSTIFGALNYAVEKLTTAFPYIQIVVVSPIFRTKLNNDEINVETYRTSAGYTMPELVSKEKECCDYNHYEFLDAYHELGINKHNSGTMLLSDGTHLDYEAMRRIGRLVAGYIFTH